MKRTYVLTLTLLILIGFLPLFSFQGSEANMFRGDENRSGIFESIVPVNNALLWSYKTQSASESSPVVVDERIYFGAEDGKVYCVNATDGSHIWNFTTGNEVDSTPTVVNDVVYVGSADTNLYALNATNGSELWRFPIPDPMGQVVSSPAVANDLVFVGAKDGSLYAINITTHNQEWAFTTGDEIWSSPTVEWPFVYFGSLDGNVHCLWGENGTEKWHFTVNLSMPYHGVYSSPLITSHRVYIGSEDHGLYGLNKETGDLEWSFIAPHYIYSSAAVDDGRVFIHAQGAPWGQIYALPENDPDGDGIIDETEVLWSFETRDIEGGSSPTLAGGMVLAGSTTGKLYCLDQETGEEMWNLTTGGQVIGTPWVADGVVYITSKDGTLYAVGGNATGVLDLQIIPEFSSIKSGRIMGISFLVTYGGRPVEGAFVTMDLDLGNLSQFGASTFPDGSQRVKYTAPDVTENTTVTVSARAARYAYKDGETSASFVVEPSASYSDVGSGSSVTLSKYAVYIALITILVIINIIIIIASIKRRNKKDKGKTEGEQDS